MPTPGLDPARWTVEVHRHPLMELHEKVAPDHTALLVIDVQNDFCAEEGRMAADGMDVTAVMEMAERLPSVIDAARSAGVLVVFIRNVYNTPGNWYLSDAWLEMAARRYRGRTYTVEDMCPPDSWANDFYGDVRPRPNEPVVTKHRYSGFHNTDLDTVLQAHGTRTVVLAGVATNVCVETTAREAFVRDYYVVFPSDGTATYSEEAHHATLRNIDTFFGQVVTLDELLTVWKES